jgi:hypothetical protein
MRRAAIAAAALSTMVLAWVAPAGADPRNSGQGTLDCGDDGSYTVNVFSNGTWSPGLDADSNDVFIPTAFGEFHGTFTPSDGSEPISFTDPPMFKAAPRNEAQMSCTFHGEFEDPYGTAVVDGTVIGFKTPARH